MPNGKYSVSDIFTRVQRSFGDEASIQVTIADVIRWINDAQREIVMQHENLLQASTFIDTVEGQQDYLGPDDCFMVNALWYRDSDDSNSSYYSVPFKSVSQLDKLLDGWQGSTIQSFPVAFTRGDSGGFKIFPVIGTSRTNGFKLSYSRYATDVTSEGDTLDVPAYYHQTVLEFCMMRAYEMDEDWESSDRKAQYVQTTIDSNNSREQWFGHETYPSVTTMYEDF